MRKSGITIPKVPEPLRNFPVGSGKLRAGWQLVKEMRSQRDRQAKKRALRRISYRLLEPFYKRQYRSEAKRRTSTIDWNHVCCGAEKGLVSIILPVYNQVDLLEQSIASVLSQQYQHFELIIVNDGSTDGVESVLDKYVSHPRVEILTQPNHRLPAALNTGFSHARGEFLTWTSADNVMSPLQLTAQVRFLRQNEYAQMVFCNYEVIDEQGNPFSRGTLTNPGTNVVKTDEDIGSLHYAYNFIAGCFMYRNCVARIIGNYDSTAYGAEDYDYWMRINDDFAIFHIGREEPYYKYRIHRNTIRGREGNDAIRDVIGRAQRLHSERRAFFGKPMTLFIPGAAWRLEGDGGALKKKRPWNTMRFESFAELDQLMGRVNEDEKRVVFLSGSQVFDVRYLGILERRRRDRLLFAFGIVEDRTDVRESGHLNMFDWLVVEKRPLYDRLCPAFKEMLICVNNWLNYSNLWRIIANHHLFYKAQGRSVLYLSPKHKEYR